MKKSYVQPSARFHEVKQRIELCSASGHHPHHPPGPPGPPPGPPGPPPGPHHPFNEEEDE